MATRQRRILILGGTGFIGPHVVRAALARGHSLTLFNRGRTHPHLFPEVEKLHGDRERDLRALEGRQWDAVIDISGYLPRVVKASVDVLGPSVDHYVFISSVAVYPYGIPPGADERSPVRTLADETTEDVSRYYGELKVLCERAVERGMPGRASNLRLGLVAGPGDPTDRFTYWPVRVARGGMMLAPGSGRDPMQFVDVRDVADWTITCIEDRHLGTYNLVGPARRTTVQDLLEECLRVRRSGVVFTWVDKEFLDAMGVRPWVDLPVWSGSEDARSAASNAKAIAHGFRHHSVADTVRDTLAWFESLPEERRARLRAGLTPEREAAILAEWHRRGRAIEERPGPGFFGP